MSSLQRHWRNTKSSRDKRPHYAPDCMAWELERDMRAVKGPPVTVRPEFGELDDWGDAVPFTAMAFLAMPPPGDEKQGNEE